MMKSRAIRVLPKLLLGLALFSLALMGVLLALGMNATDAEGAALGTFFLSAVVSLVAGVATAVVELGAPRALSNRPAVRVWVRPAVLGGAMLALGVEMYVSDSIPLWGVFALPVSIVFFDVSVRFLEKRM